MVQSITVKELQQLMEAKENIQVIDVREDFEVEQASFGAHHIPMGEVVERLDEIAKDKQVIVHCRSGKRSANVIQLLQSQFDFTNLYNLEGGILAWKQEIDPSLQVE